MEATAAGGSQQPASDPLQSGDVQGPVLLDIMRAGNLSLPNSWPQWEHYGDAKAGAYGEISIRWTPQGSWPVLVAIKEIDRGLSPAEMEHMHNNAVPDWVQLTAPGLVRIFGSYLQRNQHGVPVKLYIVMEALVGRWVTLADAFEGDAIDSNIYLDGGGDPFPLYWSENGVAGEVIKGVWDAWLGIMLQLDGLQRQTRDIKPDNMMIDILSCAATYGAEFVPAAVLEKHQRLHLQLLRDLQSRLAADAGASTGAAAAAAGAAAAAAAAAVSSMENAAGQPGGAPETARSATSSAAAAAAAKAQTAANALIAAATGVRVADDDLVSCRQSFCT